MATKRYMISLIATIIVMHNLDFWLFNFKITFILILYSLQFPISAILINKDTHNAKC